MVLDPLIKKSNIYLNENGEKQHIVLHFLRRIQEDGPCEICEKPHVNRVLQISTDKRDDVKKEIYICCTCLNMLVKKRNRQ